MIVLKLQVLDTNEETEIRSIGNDFIVVLMKFYSNVEDVVDGGILPLDKVL